MKSLFYFGFKKIFKFIIIIVISKASACRIVEVFDEKIDLVDDNVSEDIPVENGDVEFDNVYF